jgi:hypothetical protein
MRIITHGATDQSIELFIVDSDGLPATGLAYNSSGIDLWYRRNGAAVTSITEATQTANGAHSDGGFVGLGNGVYRLDPPDAAFASGVSHVTFGGTLTGYTVYPVTVQLTAFDLQTATQNVNVTQLSGDSTAADNAESFFDGTGYAGTNNVIPTVTTTTNLTNKGDGSGFTAIPWNASWDAEVQSEASDALVAYDPPTNAEVEARTRPTAEYATATNLQTVDDLIDAIKAVTDQLVAAQSEPTGVPAANETPLEKLGFVFMALRNGITVTATEKAFLDDSGNQEWVKALSDDGTTYTEGEAEAP